MRFLVSGPVSSIFWMPSALAQDRNRSTGNRTHCRNEVTSFKGFLDKRQCLAALRLGPFQLFFECRDKHRLDGAGFFSEAVIQVDAAHPRQQQIENQKTRALEYRPLRKSSAQANVSTVRYPADPISRLTDLRTDSSSSTMYIDKSSDVMADDLSVLCAKDKM
jgi:hypothetical protein